VHTIAGHLVPNLTAYRVTFLVAALVALLGVPSALSITDVDAERTRVDPRLRRAVARVAPTTAPAGEPAAEPVA
jgi:hypothetical protein